MSRHVRSPLDLMDGYIHDPLRDAGPCPLTEYRAVLEAALVADHGTTLGYELHDDGVAPVLAPADPQEVQAAKRQQAVVLRFVDRLLDVECALGRPLRWPLAMLRTRLLCLLRQPRAAEAAAFGGQSHRAGQGQAAADHLAVRLPLGPALLRWRALGLWPEGTYRLSGCGVLLPALGAARAIKAWLRSRRS